MAAIWEADLGLERVYVDEGHFYYALPADLDTPEEVTEGALTWAWSCTDSSSSGPKGSAIRDWVILNTP